MSRAYCGTKSSCQRTNGAFFSIRASLNSSTYSGTDGQKFQCKRKERILRKILIVSMLYLHFSEKRLEINTCPFFTVLRVGAVTRGQKRSKNIHFLLNVGEPLFHFVQGQRFVVVSGFVECVWSNYECRYNGFPFTHESRRKSTERPDVRKENTSKKNIQVREKKTRTGLTLLDILMQQGCPVIFSIRAPVWFVCGLDVVV